MRRGSKDRDSRDNRDSRDSRDRRDSRDSRDNRDSRNSRDSRRSYRSDSDSGSEDDRYRSRSRDSSRSRSGSRGRTIKNCTYCHKRNHDWSHCYRYPKGIKKVCSGNLRIDDSRDKDEQARWQMLIDLKTSLNLKRIQQTKKGFLVHQRQSKIFLSTYYFSFKQEFSYETN